MKFFEMKNLIFPLMAISLILVAGLTVSQRKPMMKMVADRKKIATDGG